MKNELKDHVLGAMDDMCVESVESQYYENWCKIKGHLEASKNWVIATVDDGSEEYIMDEISYAGRYLNDNDHNNLRLILGSLRIARRALTLPLYKSHKYVRALKIERIKTWGAGEPGASIVFVSDKHVPIRVSDAYLAKHQPKAGGYYVVYENGYESWSPSDVFEDGNTLVENIELDKENEKGAVAELIIIFVMLLVMLSIVFYNKGYTKGEEDTLNSLGKADTTLVK